MFTVSAKIQRLMKLAELRKQVGVDIAKILAIDCKRTVQQVQWFPSGTVADKPSWLCEGLLRIPPGAGSIGEIQEARQCDSCEWESRGGLKWWKLRGRGLRLEVVHEIVPVVRDTADGDILKGWFKGNWFDVKHYGMLARAASVVK